METASRFNDTKLIWFMHLRINSCTSFMFDCITPIRNVLVNFISPQRDQNHIRGGGHVQKVNRHALFRWVVNIVRKLCRCFPRIPGPLKGFPYRRPRNRDDIAKLSSSAALMTHINT